MFLRIDDSKLFMEFYDNVCLLGESMCNWIGRFGIWKGFLKIGWFDGCVSFCGWK